MRKLFSFGLPMAGLLGLTMVLATGLLVLGYGAWTDTTNFSGKVTTGTWDIGGTPGFWKNWYDHNTYTQDEIIDFLIIINGNSFWLVPDLNSNDIVDITDMVMVFDAGEDGGNGTMEEKFLRSYLALHLNAESGRLVSGTLHDFFVFDPDNYLELNGTGTLEQIIEAIEGKYDTSPTEEEYELMKDICDTLNNIAEQDNYYGN